VRNRGFTEPAPDSGSHRLAIPQNVQYLLVTYCTNDTNGVPYQGADYATQETNDPPWLTPQLQAGHAGSPSKRSVRTNERRNPPVTFFRHDLWCPLCRYNYGYKIKQFIEFYFG